VLGWSLFAIDQIRGASTASVAGIAGDPTTFPDPNPRQEAAREKVHGTVREFIDDVNDILLAPFAGLVDSSNSEWVRRTIPALLALLVYGFGGGFLAIVASSNYRDGQTGGRGYIGLAAMIFGNWRPAGAFAAAVLFGFSSALALKLQIYSPQASTLFQVLPYVLTLVAVAGVIGRTVAPAADGKPYAKQ